MKRIKSILRKVGRSILKGILTITVRTYGFFYKLAHKPYSDANITDNDIDDLMAKFARAKEAQAAMIAFMNSQAE